MSIGFIHVRRLRDGLIVASTNDDGTIFSNQKNEEEKLLKQITQATTQLSIPGQANDYHICVYNGAYTISCTSKDFDPRLAYKLNDEVNIAFQEEYGPSLDAVEQKYAFADFSANLDAFRTKYERSVTNASMVQLQRELGEVEDSVASNLKSAIARDDRINEIEKMSQNLSKNSSIFATKATNLNRLHFWRTYGRPAVIISIWALVYLFVHFVL